jgi:hypothetical protein
MVADGSAGVAVLPISGILRAKGVDYAGSLAPEIQFLQVFSAAIVTGSPSFLVLHRQNKQKSRGLSSQNPKILPNAVK